MKESDIFIEVDCFQKNKADNMLNEWKKLFSYIVVKHNDMAEKKTDEKGNFNKTPYGYAVSPSRPGYPETYRKSITNETGDKYLVK